MQEHDNNIIEENEDCEAILTNQPPIPITASQFPFLVSFPFCCGSEIAGKKLLNDQSDQLHNFVSKQVLWKQAQTSVLSKESRGEQIKTSLLGQRVCGKAN